MNCIRVNLTRHMIKAVRFINYCSQICLTWAKTPDSVNYKEGGSHCGPCGSHHRGAKGL